jgi:hypothetical protein
MQHAQRPWDNDDIAVWPDGSWATLGEIWNGGCGWKGDDYETVRADDVARLTELGLAEEFDLL